MIVYKNDLRRREKELHHKHTSGVVSEPLSYWYFINMSNHCVSNLGFEKPFSYEITVSGIVSADFCSGIEGLSARHKILKDGKTVTILSGVFEDQALLTRLLNFIYEQQLCVIELRKL